jgi:hypothetical protein
MEIGNEKRKVDKRKTKKPKPKPNAKRKTQRPTKRLDIIWPHNILTTLSLSGQLAV